ncbi:flagellar protein FliT [Buttiauxella sp.]|uniref:flagellar protein FliT n=1 Tax=Buttiauxella sp. TaxID=1972222 RepID=UPI003C75B5A1
MDDLQLIDWQTRALAAAGKRQDWDKIHQLDSDIAAMLISMHGREITPQKREALKQLQHVHRQVHSLVRQKRDELSQEMAQQRNQREGALSYAQFMESESEEGLAVNE